jgi:hypothetical protein
MNDVHTGGCACGRIRYELREAPRASFNCHCRACQRYTGSAFIASALVPSRGFVLMQGEPVYYVSKGDNGHEISRGFCGHCGSPVVTRLARMPDHVGVPAASLDDPSWFRPTMDLFTSFAQPWDYMNPELRKFSEGPQGQVGRAVAREGEGGQ